MRRWNLTRKISIVADPTHGGHARFRVVNGGYWTITDAMLYLSLNISPEDVLPPPNGCRAHIEPKRFAPISGDQMCWSVRHPVPNPMRVPIYAKERQPFSLCHAQGDRITIRQRRAGRRAAAHACSCGGGVIRAFSSSLARTRMAVISELRLTQTQKLPWPPFKDLDYLSVIEPRHDRF
jgi:hypothetical protein